MGPMGFWVLHFIFKHFLSHVRGFDLGIPSTLLSTLAPQDQIDKPLEDPSATVHGPLKN